MAPSWAFAVSIDEFNDPAATGVYTLAEIRHFAIEQLENDPKMVFQATHDLVNFKTFNNYVGHVASNEVGYFEMDIPKDKAVTADMLIVKRPALGIHPKYVGVVVGRVARRDIRADEWITWEMLS